MEEGERMTGRFLPVGGEGRAARSYFLYDGFRVRWKRFEKSSGILVEWVK